MADYYIGTMDKAKLLMAFVNFARPSRVKKAFWKTASFSPPISLADAQDFLRRNGFYADEAFGRELRLGGDIGQDRLNPYGYDQANGPDMAARAVASVWLGYPERQISERALYQCAEEVKLGGRPDISGIIQ